MAVTSTMLPLGTQAPAFNVLDVSMGNALTLETFKAHQLLLVIFLCEHCPYVKHVQAELVKLGKEYVPKNVGIVGISSNDVKNYPDDSPENLNRMVKNLGLNFSIGYDESQAAAKAYRAACTPEFYLFDEKRTLVYRGQIDDSRPKNGLPVTGKDLRAALDAALAHQPVSGDQKPSVGCNIKWKPGQEPEYFGH